MDQFKKVWDNLSISQRITIALAAAAVFAGLFAFSRWKRESDFHPLYSAMSAEDAGLIVQKIKESGSEYRLSEDGTIVLVPSAKVAELRLQMAAAGLPKSGRIGFELFDKTSFGATEFVEHINYRRALEGELERSIMSLTEVEQARVHLTFPKDSVFLEAQQPAKASIILKLKPGARITGANVLAICNLVANSVEGLTPDGVSVVDMNGNLLSRPRKSGAAEAVPATDDMLELRQKLERDLVAKINTTLEPLLGADRFRAGASVDCELSSGEQSEETFDPAKSVMLTSQKSEESTSSTVASGAPGTASNMPRGTSRPNSTLAGLTRVTENVTYQTSRLTKHTRSPQGAIKRMSLSVLVDQTIRWEGEGSKKRRLLVPPSPENIKSIRDVVAGITGFSAERGDQLIVESLPFESTLNQEPPPPPPAANPAPAFPRRPMIIFSAAAAGLLLACGLLIAWFRKRSRKAAAQVQKALAEAEGQKELADVVALQSVAMQNELVQAGTARPELLEAGAPKLQRLTDLIRETVGRDATGSCNVVRAWLNED